MRVVYHRFGTVLPGNPVGKSFLNQKRFDSEGGGERMKLPIVRRGSRENPVSLEEINALYQSWGSAGTMLPTIRSFPTSPKGQACPVPTANTPKAPKIGSRFLPGSLCSPGPGAHAKHGSPRTQRWAGAEPLALLEDFPVRKQRGWQPATCSPCPGTHGHSLH